ncbi:zinc-binding dehydrogenase [Streptomyces sp. NPDC056529]|uniref:zinc-binding dehydrogenase n=1 Tax=Streptomyces sp. NPDC056529 TaxID=3345855 RepID=UPI0036C8E29E
MTVTTGAGATAGTGRPAPANPSVTMTGSGEPEQCVELTDAGRPSAGRGKVVVEVEAAGVSFAEVQMLQHLHPFPPRFPFVPGYDLVGRITEVGEGVTGWRAGDRVAAMPRYGAWQRHVEVPAKVLAPVPDGLDAAEAVSLVTNGVTAWQMVHRLSGARPGDTVLVHGASGGVGTLLTQIAVHHGLRVIGTASPAKHDAVRALGAEPLDYRTPDFPSAVRALAPEGVAAVFDHIGGKGLDDGWAVLAPGGTLVSFDSSVAGYEPGQWFRPHVPALRRTLTHALARLFGRTGGRRMRMYYVKPGKDFDADLGAMYELLARGVLRPEIAGRLPLGESAAALRALLDGRAVGKYVLVP